MPRVQIKPKISAVDSMPHLSQLIGQDGLKALLLCATDSKDNAERAKACIALRALNKEIGLLKQKINVMYTSIKKRKLNESSQKQQQNDDDEGYELTDTECQTDMLGLLHPDGTFVTLHLGAVKDVGVSSKTVDEGAMAYQKLIEKVDTLAAEELSNRYDSDGMWQPAKRGRKRLNLRPHALKNRDPSSPKSESESNKKDKDSPVSPLILPNINTTATTTQWNKFQKPNQQLVTNSETNGNNKTSPVVITQLQPKYKLAPVSQTVGSGGEMIKLMPGTTRYVKPNILRVVSSSNNINNQTTPNTLKCGQMISIAKSKLTPVTLKSMSMHGNTTSYQPMTNTTTTNTTMTTNINTNIMTTILPPSSNYNISNNINNNDDDAISIISSIPDISELNRYLQSNDMEIENSLSTFADSNTNININSTTAMQKSSSSSDNAMKQRMFTMWQLCDAIDKDGYALIHRAILNDDVAMLKVQCMARISKRLDLNIRDSKHRTPLELAVLNNSACEIFTTLLAQQYPVAVDTRQHQTGNTIAHLAVDHINDMQKFRCIVRAAEGQLVHYNNEGYTPLHLAVRHHPSVNLAKVNVLLLSQNCSEFIDLPDTGSGRTALFYAVEANNFELVQMLLVCHSDPTLTTISGLTLNDVMSELSDAVSNRIRDYVQAECHKRKHPPKDKRNVVVACSGGMITRSVAGSKVGQPDGIIANRVVDDGITGVMIISAPSRISGRVDDDDDDNDRVGAEGIVSNGIMDNGIKNGTGAPKISQADDDSGKISTEGINNGISASNNAMSTRKISRVDDNKISTDGISARRISQADDNNSRISSEGIISNRITDNGIQKGTSAQKISQSDDNNSRISTEGIISRVIENGITVRKIIHADNNKISDNGISNNAIGARSRISQVDSNNRQRISADGNSNGITTGKIIRQVTINNGPGIVGGDPKITARIIVGGADNNNGGISGRIRRVSVSSAGKISEGISNNGIVTATTTTANINTKSSNGKGMILNGIPNSKLRLVSTGINKINSGGIRVIPGIRLVNTTAATAGGNKINNKAAGKGISNIGINNQAGQGINNGINSGVNDIGINKAGNKININTGINNKAGQVISKAGNKINNNAIGSNIGINSKAGGDGIKTGDHQRKPSSIMKLFGTDDDLLLAATTSSSSTSSTNVGTESHITTSKGSQENGIADVLDSSKNNKDDDGVDSTEDRDCGIRDHGDDVRDQESGISQDDARDRRGGIKNNQGDGIRNNQDDDIRDHVDKINEQCDGIRDQLNDDDEIKKQSDGIKDNQDGIRDDHVKTEISKDVTDVIDYDEEEDNNDDSDHDEDNGIIPRTGNDGTVELNENIAEAADNSMDDSSSPLHIDENDSSSESTHNNEGDHDDEKDNSTSSHHHHDNDDGTTPTMDVTEQHGEKNPATTTTTDIIGVLKINMIEREEEYDDDDDYHNDDSTSVGGNNTTTDTSIDLLDSDSIADIIGVVDTNSARGGGVVVKQDTTTVDDDAAEIVEGSELSKKMNTTDSSARVVGGRVSKRTRSNNSLSNSGNELIPASQQSNESHEDGGDWEDDEEKNVYGKRTRLLRSVHDRLRRQRYGRAKKKSTNKSNNNT